MCCRSEREQLAAEISEIRGIVAAVRDDAFRYEQMAHRRTSDLLGKFNNISEGAKIAAASASQETHERIEATIKIVNILSRDVGEVRRVQESIDLRFNAELRAGRSAIARATTAAEHADAVSLERLFTTLLTRSDLISRSPRRQSTIS